MGDAGQAVGQNRRYTEAAAAFGPALERLEKVAREAEVELLLPDEEVEKHGVGEAEGDLSSADVAVVLGGPQVRAAGGRLMASESSALREDRVKPGASHRDGRVIERRRADLGEFLSILRALRQSLAAVPPLPRPQQQEFDFPLAKGA